MMDFLSWVASRMSEPSTYAGVAAMLASLHIYINSDVQSSVTTIGIGLAGLLAFLLKEKGLS